MMFFVNLMKLMGEYILRGGKEMGLVWGVEDMGALESEAEVWQ